MATLRSTFSQFRETLSLAHLITESNIKAFVLPTTFCGLMSVASGGTTADAPSWLEIAAAFPKVLLYIWLWDLYFDCSNQKHPESIEEDRLNKPWRAIPSGRLSIEAAERWYVCAAFILPAVCIFWLGGLAEAVAFMLETYAYDFLSGGKTWWGRSIINPMFFATGQLGAMRVASISTNTWITKAGYEWVLIHALVVFSTIHLQDLRDQEGDAARGRTTLPLVIGDGWCRGLMTFFVCFFSVAIPTYWQCSIWGYLLPGITGAVISGRFLLMKDVKADRKNFHLHSLVWLPALYSTPLFSQAVGM